MLTPANWLRTGELGCLFYVQHNTDVFITIISQAAVRSETIISKVIQRTKNGWGNVTEELQGNFQPYWKRIQDLSVEAD